jgi:hypothetical protein
MQKPMWRFKTTNDKSIVLQAKISPGIVAILVNEEVIETHEISGSKNNIPIELYGSLFSLNLRKKPVGGYDYSLVTQKGNEIVAVDYNPSVALSSHAEKVADEMQQKHKPKMFLFVLGLIFGGCLGLVFVAIGIGVSQSDRSKTSKTILYILLIVLTLSWDIILIFLLNSIGHWVTI